MRDDDWGVGSCSPGGSIFPKPRKTRVHYRENEHRLRTSCDRPVEKMKCSDDPREVTCVRCQRAELW